MTRRHALALLTLGVAACRDRPPPPGDRLLNMDVADPGRCEAQREWLRAGGERRHGMVRFIDPMIPADGVGRWCLGDRLSEQGAFAGQCAQRGSTKVCRDFYESLDREYDAAGKLVAIRAHAGHRWAGDRKFTRISRMLAKQDVKLGTDAQRLTNLPPPHTVRPEADPEFGSIEVHHWPGFWIEIDRLPDGRRVIGAIAVRTLK